jgi:hypothetical protein
MEPVAVPAVREVRIGDARVRLLVHVSGEGTPTYVHVHENERTALEAARRVFRETGGRLLELRAQGKRLIVFRKNDREYRFDPNRIFTPDGIERTLRRYGAYSETARDEVGHLARHLLDAGVVDASRMVVAVHNNAAGEYTARSYVPPGPLARQAEAVHVNSLLGVGDFFIVTDRRLFEELRARGWNVVLQDNQRATDDGSLSVYCGRRRIPYANVEARYGHLETQIDMLRDVARIQLVHKIRYPPWMTSW